MKQAACLLLTILILNLFFIALLFVVTEKEENDPALPMGNATIVEAIEKLIKKARQQKAKDALTTLSMLRIELLIGKLQRQHLNHQYLVTDKTPSALAKRVTKVNQKAGDVVTQNEMPDEPSWAKLISFLVFSFLMISGLAVYACMNRNETAERDTRSIGLDTFDTTPNNQAQASVDLEAGNQ